jgi:hypothetical protein
MGFRPEPTIYNLSFQGTALDGLHVRVSCCTLGEYSEMMRASLESLIVDINPTDNLDIEKLRELRDMVSSRYKDNNRILELFANHLVSWDLEDLAGQPVPATREGMDTQERPLIAQLVSAWQTAMVSVPNRSSTSSSNGEISEEQSLGLGNASKNLGS